MNIDKQESERILKSAYASNVTSITLRKNDTAQNKKQEFQRLASTVNSKITGSKEVTVILVEI